MIGGPQIFTQLTLLTEIDALGHYHSEIRDRATRSGTAKRKRRKRNMEKENDDWWPSKIFTIYTTFTLLTKPDALGHYHSEISGERAAVTRGKLLR